MGLTDIEGVNERVGHRTKSYSDDELIRIMREFKDEHGKINSSIFRGDPNYPSPNTIINRFGSWNDGLKEAGISINEEYGTVVEPTDEMYEPSSEKAYVIGAYLGDGHISDAKQLVLNVKDVEFAIEFARKLCKFLNLEWGGWDDDATEIICSKRKDGMYAVKKSISPVYDIFRKYDAMEFDPVDVKNEYVDHPESMLRGLWDAEGSIDTNKRVHFYNTSDKIIELYIELVTDAVIKNHIDEKGFDVLTQYYKDKLTVTESNGLMDVYLPAELRRTFYKTVSPTIKRKRDRF